MTYWREPAPQPEEERPSWAGKNVWDLSNDERRSLFDTIRAGVRKLRPLGRKPRKGEIVEVYTVTTHPFTSWKCFGPVEKGQYVFCPEASDKSFPAGHYVVAGIGQAPDGYSGNLRRCYPATQNTGAAEKPLMSGIDPEFFQRN